jgi:hypothetical protein
MADILLSQTSVFKFVPLRGYTCIFLYILWIRSWSALATFVYFKFPSSQFLLYLRHFFSLRLMGQLRVVIAYNRSVLKQISSAQKKNYIYKETKHGNQINNKLTFQNNPIFEAIVQNPPRGRLQTPHINNAH